MESSVVNHRAYYTALPPETTKFLQLRFKLQGFPGVYRTVKLPYNYTFAHLHTFIQFLFGWNGGHLHKFSAYTHVEKYAKSNKAKTGEMKKYGHAPPLPSYISKPGDVYYGHEKAMWERANASSAYYEIVSSGSRTRKSRKRRESRRSDGSPGRGADYVEKVEDHELILGNIWNSEKELNMSSGRCNNEELGVVYEYDFGASWIVHITLDREDDFFIIDEPRNLPIVMEAQGAPWMEDTSSEDPDELDPDQKEVSELLFDGRAFEKYCQGEFDSFTGKRGLVIYGVEQARASRASEGTSDSDNDIGVEKGTMEGGVSVDKTQAGGYRLNDLD